MISRNTIKDKIVLALQPLHVSQGGQVKDIGECDPNILQDLKKLLPRCPALYVSYGNSPTAKTARQQITKGHFFSVFVFYKSLHSKVTSERGAVALVEEIEAVLENNCLGLSIEPLTPAGDGFLAEDSGVTMYALNYTTGQSYTKEYIE